MSPRKMAVRLDEFRLGYEIVTIGDKAEVTDILDYVKISDLVVHENPQRFMDQKIRSAQKRELVRSFVHNLNS